MKKANLLIAASLIALGANAEVLSPAQALARVNSNSGARRIAARCLNNLQPEITVAAHSGAPELYLFAPAQGGLMILSADSDAPALLGYSENFQAGQELPPALEMMLEGYAEEINAIRDGLEPASSGSRADNDFKAIDPICQTYWNQLDPYNELTPTINGARTPTGCVATAMAQVIKVHQYPAKCSGGTFTYETAGTTVSLNFDNVKLDWANMLNKYNGAKDPQVNRTAVATLMQALGYAAYTGYKTTSSGASTPNMCAGMVKYFDYDDAAITLERQWFFQAQWEKMVYDEIAAGYPMFYSGMNSAGGGHAFVVDGYKGDGLFHVNWGWGGTSDGYFLLTALDPKQQGVGGSTAGYSQSNAAIFNLRPGKKTAYSDVPLTFFGNGGFRATSSRVKLGQFGGFAYSNPNGATKIYNRAPANAVQPRSAIKFVAENGTEYFSHCATEQSQVVAPLYGLDCGTIQIPANLPAGNYTCYPQVWSAVTGKYYPVYYPVTNAFTIPATVANGYITFGSSEAPSVKVSDFTLPDVVQTNVPFQVTGRATNTTPYDMDAAVCLGIYDAGKPVRRGEIGQVCGQLQAGKSVEFNTQLTLTNTSLVSGIYDLAFFNSQTNQIISDVKQIELKAPVDAATIRVSKITCTNPSKAHLEFTLNVSAAEGDFDGQVYVEIHQAGQSGYVERFQSQPIKIAAKKTETVVLADEFKDGEVGQEYTAQAYYWHLNQYVVAPGNKTCTFTLTEGAAIGEIEASAAEAAVYYDLSGRRVAKPVKGEIYITKNGKIKF